MQLPQLFKKKTQSTGTSFFAIHLSDQVVQSALWKVDQGLLEVVSKSTQKKWTDEESCISAVDQSLQELSLESEKVTETLFALSPEWVTAEGILPAKKALFQKMAKELSLDAIGFVVTTEVLLQHFTQTLSPQLSLFLIEVASSKLFVTQVKMGKLLQTEKVGRSGEIISDLVEGFAHFKEKVFPSKFLLYSSILTEEELLEIRQLLFDHDWTSDYPFLHPPIIDIFAPGHVLEIIILTGGRAVAESKGLHLLKMPQTKGLDQADISGKFVIQPEQQKSETKTEPEETANIVDPSQAIISGELENESQEETAEFADSDADSLEEDMLEDQETAASADDENVSPVANQEISFGESDEVPVLTNSIDSLPQRKIKADSSAEHVETTSSDSASLFGGRIQLPSKLRFVHMLPFLIGGTVLGLLLLWGIGFVAAKNLSKAVVTVQLKPLPVSKEVVLTLDPNATVSDPSQLLMKAEVVTQDEQGTKTAQATGTKIIGEKAKGTVTLYNRTSSPKAFSAGTVLSSDKLKFALNSDVTVASASSGTDPTIINVGTANGAVTAVAIGAESNIAKDKDLLIDTFSKDSYFARTTSDFSGGTSREILAVSVTDQAKLKNALLQELTAQAATDFKASSTNGRYIIPTNQVKITKSTFTAEVGKETDNFSLTLQAQALGLAYQFSELRPLATQLLSASLPEKYQVQPDQIQVLSSPTPGSSTSGQVKLATNVSSIALPVLDYSQLKKEIAGKSPKATEELLKQKTGIQSVKVSLSPSIFSLFSNVLPTQVEKIQIVVGK